MKIEDINYTLPTNQIDVKNFDREKWLQENPIDYFKFIYILFTSNNITPQLPREIVMKTAFEALYRVTRLYIPDTLYKFYSLTSDEDLNKKKFSTLKNKQIFMSDLKDFNDPFDGKAFFYDHKKLERIERLVENNGRLIDDFTVFYKCTSLTENNTGCMPMWAHYANNHHGFCVAYDMENHDNLALSACTFPIQYTDKRLDITSFMKEYAEMLESEVDIQLAQGKKKVQISDMSIVYLLQYLENIKYTTWQYEKEYRCSMSAAAKGMPYIDATPKAIYIGMNCKEHNRKELIKIAKQLSVPIYHMKLNELDKNYSLEEVLIEA